MQVDPISVDVHDDQEYVAHIVEIQFISSTCG